MLPPDRENRTFLKYIGHTIKSIIKNPYDENMLSKYVDTTIEAMFYEFDRLELNSRKFTTFEEVLFYLDSVFCGTQRIFKRKYDSIPVINKIKFV